MQDAAFKKICGLLQSDDPMRRTAAAIVLGELAPDDAAVVRALGEALPGANQLLTTAILDALEAIGHRDALPHLVPLLDAEDVAVKLRASAAITRAGGAALPLIRPLLADAGASKKLVLVDLLARIPTVDALRSLLSLLPDADADLTVEIAEAVHRHARAMTPAQRTPLHKLVVQFMDGAPVRASERLQGAGLRLLGALACPEARTVLLRWAGAADSPRLRLQALRGMQNLAWTSATAKPVAPKMLQFMGDTDPEVAQQALRVLTVLPADVLTTAQWRALLDYAFTPARGLALARLAADTSPAGGRVLLALLQHADEHVRETAAGALARQPQVAGAVLEALLDKADIEQAWRLAKILKPHAATLPSRDQKRLKERAARGLAAKEPTIDALLYLLRQADAPAADAVIREAAFAAVRAKRWGDAVAGLRRVMNSPGFDDECRYALSLCNLKQSPKELAPHLRAEDYALRGFQGLLRSPDFNLAARLVKEPAVEAEDLYFVGFHFSDLTGDERAFGEGLLRHVIKTWPRTPAGKAAKIKLGVANGVEPTAKSRPASPPPSAPRGRSPAKTKPRS
ncbi:MAG: hypothetical protein K8T26_10265 [Lentisphaerae bacterium]|nr:hypothetical protein [Lentisphaerota bacterium]